MDESEVQTAVPERDVRCGVLTVTVLGAHTARAVWRSWSWRAQQGPVGEPLGLQARSHRALKNPEPLLSGGRGCGGRRGLEPSERTSGFLQRPSFLRFSRSIVNKMEGTSDICLSAIKKTP